MQLCDTTRKAASVPDAKDLDGTSIGGGRLKIEMTESTFFFKGGRANEQATKRYEGRRDFIYFSIFQQT